MTTKFLDNKICTFKILLSWLFPRKKRFWTILLSAPKAHPPQKRKFYFYCRLAVSEICLSHPPHLLNPHLRHSNHGLRCCSWPAEARIPARNLASKEWLHYCWNCKRVRPPTRVKIPKLTGLQKRITVHLSTKVRGFEKARNL